MLLWGFSVSSSDHREYYSGYDLKLLLGMVVSRSQNIRGGRGADTKIIVFGC